MGVEALRARADAKAADLAPIINELWADGKTSLRAIAAGLNDAGGPTERREMLVTAGDADTGAP